MVSHENSYDNPGKLENLESRLNSYTLKLKEEIKIKNEEIKIKNEEIEKLKKDIKNLKYNKIVKRTTDEIEFLKNALIKELKEKDDFLSIKDEPWLNYFFSASIFIHSRELSKLNKILLFLTSVLIIMAIIQIIIFT